MTVEPTEKAYAMVEEIFAPIARDGAAYLEDFDTAALVALSGFPRFATRLQQEHAARLAVPR